MGGRGQYCDLGGPFCPPEEEFGQLYGNQRADGKAPNVDREVGSDEWGKSVPSTCDWRKARGVISSVKNQVSAPPTLLQSSPSGGRERGRKAQPPYPAPALSH